MENAPTRQGWDWILTSLPTLPAASAALPAASSPQAFEVSVSAAQALALPLAEEPCVAADAPQAGSAAEPQARCGWAQDDCSVAVPAVQALARDELLRAYC